MGKTTASTEAGTKATAIMETTEAVTMKAMTTAIVKAEAVKATE
jgi:hypothetical protein